MNSSTHWLTFDTERRITGCHCGFAADIEADCGWGDSVVEHLLNLERDTLRQIVSAYTNPGSDDPEDRMFEIAQAALACCDLHRPSACCDPNDCGPCCESCPTCPTLAKMRAPNGFAIRQHVADLMQPSAGGE